MSTLRSYIFLDRLQPQLMCLLGSTARGFLPRDNDAAMVIDTAVEDLKTALRHDLPPKAAEVARAAASDEEAVEGIREYVDQALSSIASSADQYRARAAKAKQTLQEAS
jgi:ABC-type transporter Mla subunit MlaD